MFKRGFVVAACGALALLLTAAGTSPAQVFIGNRGGVGFWPGVSYPVGPGYYNFYRPGVSSFMGPTGYSSYTQYSYTGPTTLYYGAASFGQAYSYGSASTGRLVSPPAGTGVRAAADVTSAAYPVQSPNYMSVYPVSPPISVVAAMTAARSYDTTACVEVCCPDCADLWFDGHRTTQAGTDRCFRSPDLEAGQDYVYEVRAHWVADGKPVETTRKVTVRAGEHIVVRLE